ncbi:MAG: hypothetical protein MUP76_07255 [Acidimicrobiia bacterium]|nr:hypothetical protein [Acidimicrobiia bacterium]
MALACMVMSGCTAGEAASTTTTSAARSPLYVDEWGALGVATVCLGGSEHHTGTPASFTPIIDSIRQSFDDAGQAQIVTSGCDVTIDVEVNGQPLSESYNIGVAGRFYTGADVTGTISLSADGRTSLVASISNRMDPPDSFVLPEWKDPPSDPIEAPIWRTVEDGVCAAFAEWFGGTEVTNLLKEIRGSWPPRGDECGGYGEQSNPLLNPDS